MSILPSEKEHASILGETGALHNTTKNASWIIGARMTMLLMSFAFITGLANLVPGNVVGSFNYIVAVLTILSIFTLPGMNTSLIRAVSRGYEGTVRPMMRRKLLFGLIGSGISLVIAAIYLIHGENTLGYAFLVVAPLIPMADTWSEMAFSFFQGRKDFKKSMILSVIGQAILSIPSLIVLFFTHNLVLIVGSFFVFQVIGGILSYSTVKPINAKCDVESEKLGIHLTLMNVFRTVSANIDTIIVWYVVGPFAVAVYSFATTPMDKLEQLIPIDTVSLPNLSTSQPSKKNKHLVVMQTILLVLLMVPVIASAYLVTPLVFHIIFPHFPGSIPLFRILLLTLLTTPFSLIKTSLTAWNKKQELYVNETIVPIIKITLMTILGIKFGIMGVIIGLLSSRFIEVLILSILFARTKVRIA